MSGTRNAGNGQWFCEHSKRPGECNVCYDYKRYFFAHICRSKECGSVIYPAISSLRIIPHIDCPKCGTRISHERFDLDSLGCRFVEQTMKLASRFRCGNQCESCPFHDPQKGDGHLQ